MAKMTCGECGAKCCRDVSVEIDKPEDFEDFETIKWLIAHRNVSVYISNEDEWLVEFATDCEMLDKNNKCKIYNERYPVCSSHNPDECVIGGEGEHYKRLFTKSGEVDKYMKEIGFYEKYLKEKKKLIEKRNRGKTRS